MEPYSPSVLSADLHMHSKPEYNGTDEQHQEGFMARHKAFDTAIAIDKAMQLFWKCGYEQTSLNDLLNHIGIGRASFYNAFGDKHTLFMTVLKCYQSLTHDVIIIDTLRKSDSGLAGIHSVFDQIVDSLASDREHRGCLLVNTAVEVAPNDDEVAALIHENTNRCESAFSDALLQAREAGEISRDIDPRATARFLLNTIRGMRVTGRTTHNRQVFDDIARVTLATLHD
jgi:TetR/AcrR family transcriptional regulator, transcriptional repressor for nem operon